MTRLDQLIDKFGAISLGGGSEGDMFLYVKDFFMREDVQKRMVELNQQMLFRNRADNEGRSMGTYRPRTARHKAKMGLPSDEYTFYETGSFYNSMGVDVKDTEVEITSSTDSLKVDTIYGHSAPVDMNHIQYMFSRYNPSKSAMGLTEGAVDEVVRDQSLDMSGTIINHLKEYLNG